MLIGRTCSTNQISHISLRFSISSKIFDCTDTLVIEIDFKAIDEIFHEFTLSSDHDFATTSIDHDHSCPSAVINFSGKQDEYRTERYRLLRTARFIVLANRIESVYFSQVISQNNFEIV